MYHKYAFANLYHPGHVEGKRKHRMHSKTDKILLKLSTRQATGKTNANMNCWIDNKVTSLCLWHLGHVAIVQCSILGKEVNTTAADVLALS